MEKTPEKQYWLFKTEPGTYSIDDLRRDRKTEWWGVRNYQARNFLRDSMRVGDPVLIYHSNTSELGIAGVARVASGPLSDSEQFRKGSGYYDPKSSRKAPRWISREIAFVRKFGRIISLGELKGEKALAGLVILRPGNRLSVTPLTREEFDTILDLEKRMPRGI